MNLDITGPGTKKSHKIDIGWWKLRNKLFSQATVFESMQYSWEKSTVDQKEDFKQPPTETLTGSSVPPPNASRESAKIVSPLHASPRAVLWKKQKQEL